MAIATLTTKGQVTIPKEVRDFLKLRKGDKIEIIATKEGEGISRPISKKVDDVFCRLHSPEKKPVTVESMNNAIKDRMQDKFK